MSSSLLNSDFKCSDCNSNFDTASNLLAHFAVHVNEVNKTSDKSESEIVNKKKKDLPDLYPIERTGIGIGLKNDEPQSEPVELNPIHFCLISMDEHEPKNLTLLVPNRKKRLKRQYRCTYCSKIFGWATDLKRHVLTHTGERPFRCRVCDADFTRNFLLQKHEMKMHPKCINGSINNNIPSLKPIFTTKTKESRKQDKQKIKRNCLSV